MTEVAVILVDTNNNFVGTMPKLEAHKQGALHRAFSICIFNTKGQLLLQQRSLAKYHTPGLWTNTCCSHQVPHEPEEQTLSERLYFEMGVKAKLKHAFDMLYHASFENGLTEHEYDLVFVGKTDEQPQPNPDEVAAYRWVDWKNINIEIHENPQLFTPWFVLMLPQLKPYFTISE